MIRQPFADLQAETNATERAAHEVSADIRTRSPPISRHSNPSREHAMTAIKPAGLDAFLRKPDPAIAALLIYGEEPDAVRELAQRAVKKVAGSLDDPFTVTTLLEQDLASDPARLADEVQSISMFGGQKAIWIKGAGDAFLKAVLPVLEGKTSGNLVVAEAAALAKSSQLRAEFEKSPHALVVPLYEAEPGEIAAHGRAASREGQSADRPRCARPLHRAGRHLARAGAARGGEAGALLPRRSSA